MNELWTVVHAEREALIADLETVPADRWSTPSLCPGWDVHDLLAHLVDDARTTKASFLLRFAAARFDFDRYNRAGVERERASEPRLTLDAFRAASRRTTGAPAPKATRLVEAFVHGEDIRRPLGISRDYPVEPVVTALRYQLRTSVGAGGGKQRAQGLRLVATDSEVDHGDGPEVRGTTLALLLAVSGRPVGSAELTGSGVPALTR
ncbi:maleylpyruvate isomerase family mycothiol-dependent enzyme [Amycolatopsis suaedae]|uniref:Maleylpyruvate isomerase family mycothiol-dependent enzyme n=1 Tax=Amycolatopsis suaedae TaxID=2510978 RepID=A0A4Q7JBA3_9PSEU|nr:maleylpyruvate isomerase family mycothiol-dependent enzyme [Amycolatopsis suaedae]RZQ64358.1 maleylpyruvate isomerase family mycothiol-dependent enzyme [Amycolatopsis suaedae]